MIWWILAITLYLWAGFTASYIFTSLDGPLTAWEYISFIVLWPTIAVVMYLWKPRSLDEEIIALGGVDNPEDGGDVVDYEARYQELLAKRPPNVILFDDDGEPM